VRLQRVGDVGRVGAQLQAAEDEQALAPVVVAGVDLEVGRRQPEAAHPHDAHGVDAGPRPPPRAQRAAQDERVVVGREPRTGAEPDERGGADHDASDPEQQPARRVESARARAEGHPREQAHRPQQAEDDRGDGRGPPSRELRMPVVRVVHRLRPQWGRMTPL
jgi:hypothetical protein